MSAAAPVDVALRILVIDDEEAIRVTLSMCLEAEGHSVTAHGGIEDALEETSRRVFDLIYLDLRLGLQNGLDFLPRLVAENPWAKVVVITAYASVATAVQAMKLGAVDYLPKPFTLERAVILCRADRIGLEHFPPNMLNTSDSYRLGDLVPLDTIEDMHIKRVLESTGSIKGAAAALGIGVSTMVRWVKRTSMSPPPDLPLQDAAEATSGGGNEGAAR